MPSEDALPQADSSELTELPSEVVPDPPVVLPDSATSLKIGIFGAFSALVAASSVSVILSGDQPITWATIVLVVVGFGGLFLSWLAWRSGGFENIKKLRAVSLVHSTYTRIMSWLHSLGKAAITIATILAFLKVGTIVTGQPDTDPDDLLSKVAWYGFLGGFALVLITSRRKEATVMGRMTELQESLDLGKSAIDNAFRGLAAAHRQLETVRRDIERKSRSLKEKMSQNAKLARALETDPEKVKELQAVGRKSNGINILVTVVMTLIGFLLGLIGSAAHWDKVIAQFLGIDS
ncbi:hypothetical protein [Pseudarthrobacter sp. WHRI 8279]|uniref:hypothetical protein n=1 Tax=Pseudarthrobacter sp. WHRI 8279 TaxID=3162566 RepID=UPI0032EE1DCA